MKRSTGCKLLALLLAVGMAAGALSGCKNNYKEIFDDVFALGNSSQTSSATSSDAQSSQGASSGGASSDAAGEIPSETPALPEDVSKPDKPDSDPEIALTGIEFRFPTASIDDGASSRLRYTVQPENADVSDLKWVSDKPEIVSVSNLGKITANSPGQARITAYSEKYDVRVSCTIYVKDIGRQDEPEEIEGSEDGGDSGLFEPDEGDGESGEPINPIPPSRPNSSGQSSSSAGSSSNVSSIASGLESSGINTSQPSSGLSSISSGGTGSEPSEADELADQYIKVKQPNGDIVVMTVLDYVVFNTGREVNSSFEDEAIKAQAVAIYTYYIMYNMSGSADWARTEREILFNADGSVDYATVVKNHPTRDGSFDRLVRLCREVLGQTILYNGKAICASFSATNRGASQSNAPYWSSTPLPYLARVESPWDKNASTYLSTKTFTKAQMQEKLLSLDDEIVLEEDPAEWLAELDRDVPDEGYVLYATVGGVTVKGGKIRSLLGLRSTCFFADYNAETETFTITVHGYGHGIGMSQNGANGMAKEGQSWQGILTHYYTGVTIGYREPKFYEV